ncbi:MAG: hypothetical protein KAI43_13100 [Candidatus Aureabacteria bacterium]|nr:hypothetical protein [Candidatus Auribacterota bacterium]
MRNIFILSFLFISFLGCATTYEAVGTKESIASQDKEDIAIPEYTGEKTRVAVLPIAMTKKTVEDYPEYTAELKKKSVGFSLWNKITDTLYDTKRFKFVEVSEEIVKQIIDQWWLGDSGVADPSTALKMGKLKQAEDFIYGEITEFGVDKIEKVSGLKSSKKEIFRIGVHIRYVDGETLEFVPATGVGKGSSIEEASENAIKKAVSKLVSRLD